LDGKSVYELIEAEGVTFAAGVPTVWQMLLGHMKPAGLKFSKLNRTVIGGSACPPAMITAFREDYGVDVLHAWGMTELSPLGTLCTLKNKHQNLPEAEQMKLRMKQGRCIFGIEMKIVDEQGKELPHDGKAAGTCWCKGRGSSPRISNKKAPALWWTAGSLQVMWPPSMPMASCRSLTAART
jgi:fatty-acyl-CoA synthase